MRAVLLAVALATCAREPVVVPAGVPGNSACARLAGRIICVWTEVAR
jgi:hypothetical protein